MMLQAGDLQRGLDEKKKDAAMRLLQIQQSKEELYDLIAGFEADYSVNGSLGVQNTRLLRQLSVQIKPKNDDPRWYASLADLCRIILISMHVFNPVIIITPDLSIHT
jgi:hypothetical protein